MPKQSPHDADEIAPGTVVDGRYRIVRPIGQGGNGMVYEVEHARTGRKLALKALLDETGFARLEQEARAASLMKNGHTARIIDMEAGGPTGAYLVMELLEGQSLRALLDDAGQLPLELTMNMAMQVCECLHEAHGLGIIHRDLKPENVFLCASPWPGQYDVKVLDFGVMKIAEGGGAIPKSSLTRTGSTVGTPYYMSLEQLRNSSAVDARADVYSLGVVLYECLSGRKPFQADTIGDLVYALCSGPPTHLARVRPDLPVEVAEMVMRTLSANRDERPASMLDLAVSLLPHSNPAFALWVKVDGKQPALARPPSPSLVDADHASARAKLAPRPVPASPVSAAAPPLPTFQPGVPSAPRPPGEPWSPRGVPTPPSVPSPAASEKPFSKAEPPKPPPPTAPLSGPAAPRPAPERGRRDTPTEMFLKSVHGEDPEAPILAEPSEDDGRAGDRDTPTRAIALDSLQRSPQLSTLKSPAGLDDGSDVPEMPTVDLRGMAQPLSLGEAPPAKQPLTPGATTAKLTIPLGDFMRNLPPDTQPLAPPAPEPAAPLTFAPPKPPWQVTLDRMLFAVGQFAEQQFVRFRQAPQNTQIIVVIVAGTVAILVLGLVLFLAMR